MAARKRARTKERMREALETPLEVHLARGTIARPLVPLPEHIGNALRGRPTAYKAEFCQLVLELAAQGFSLGGVAGQIGITRSTINKWIDAHPEFSEACSRAAAGRLWFWESVSIHVGLTGGSGSQGQMAIFQLLNAARCIDNVKAVDYIDRKEIEHSGNISLAGVVERMFAKLDDALAKRAPGDDAKLIEHVSSTNAPDDADFW